MKIVALTIDRYPEVLALMRCTPGICVRDADSPEAAARYLARNPGLSFIVEADGRVVGCALCGHDGRRGYLQHVVVQPEYRRRGIAQALVAGCLDGLAQIGIAKAHLDVLATNSAAHAYWSKRGWQRRDDIQRYSFVRSRNPDA